MNYQCNLASSCGQLGRSTVLKNIDDGMKIMIDDTFRGTNEQDVLSWEDSKVVMRQNPDLESIGGSEFNRSNMLKNSGMSTFKFDGSADRRVVDSVNEWFRELINDEDILHDTDIPIDYMAKFVAKTGARVVDSVTILFKDEHKNKDFIAVGILRYPDLKSPYFKLYRIRLTASRKCRRYVMFQGDDNVINGYFQCMKFRPIQRVIDSLTRQEAN